ncbi:MAG: polysaccharide deacetylase family protein, partial [Candidatus Aenigmarchaeota archaeon]|nr:polysaccharide deacetylase family protein [Candidatus Aenigmarchaeota archaeon]MDI6722835.1 polysaccharide deacetylase family protein [Candidatus Aenigmarchaeota archaeon]
MDKFPVFLTFDLDGEAATRNAKSVGEPGIDDPAMGRFGLTEGYQNVMDVLKRTSTKASFQVVGCEAATYPKAIRDIAADGHELAIHSFSHPDYRMLGCDDVRDQICRTMKIIEKTTGKRPIGHRSPYWRPSPYLPQIFQEFGIKWNSDAYTVWDDRTVLRSRDAAGVLELPSSERFDDWTCFLTKGLDNDCVLDLWISELERYSREGDVFVLTSHPFISGQKKYASALGGFVDYIL